MGLFREVELPVVVSGRLFLHRMPGRDEALGQIWAELESRKIAAVVCLAESTELGSKSPDYAKALERNTVPCEVIRFDIPDFGVPSDRSAFWELALGIAERLRAGDNLLIHCAAGRGRTGTLAECVLIALGADTAAAHQAVEDAGSRAETPEQRELILWCTAQRAAAR